MPLLSLTTHEGFPSEFHLAQERHSNASSKCPRGSGLPRLQPCSPAERPSPPVAAHPFTERLGTRPRNFPRSSAGPARVGGDAKPRGPARSAAPSPPERPSRRVPAPDSQAKARRSAPVRGGPGRRLGGLRPPKKTRPAGGEAGRPSSSAAARSLASGSSPQSHRDHQPKPLVTHHLAAAAPVAAAGSAPTEPAPQKWKLPRDATEADRSQIPRERSRAPRGH